MPESLFPSRPGWLFYLLNRHLPQAAEKSSTAAIRIKNPSQDFIASSLLVNPVCDIYHTLHPAS